MTIGRLPFATSSPVASCLATTFWLLMEDPNEPRMSLPKYLRHVSAPKPTTSRTPKAISAALPVPAKITPMKRRIK